MNVIVAMEIGPIHCLIQRNLWEHSALKLFCIGGRGGGISFHQQINHYSSPFSVCAKSRLTAENSEHKPDLLRGSLKL